jgi:hypothetical protein
MARFGEDFDKTEYQPLAVEHVSIPNINDDLEREFLTANKLDKARLASIQPMIEPYAVKTGKVLLTNTVIRSSDITPGTDLANELQKTVVKAAPTAHVYPIQSDQPGIDTSVKQTLSVFDYYMTELGLEVLLGDDVTLPELLLTVELTCDGKDQADAVAYDIAPKDTFEWKSIVSGQIGLGVTGLLKLIPLPIVQVVAGLIPITINPWEFDWKIRKYLIGAAGELDYNIYWKLHGTDVAQSFKPTLILKVRKDVTIVAAKITCTYSIKQSKWKFWIPPQVRTIPQDVKILPV